jgi:hypothetical protein
VTFDEAVAALRSLAAEGHPVSAVVWGLDAEAAPLMTQWGILRPISGMSDDQDRESTEGLLGEIATSFAVGDGTSHTFSLRPSRFRCASVDPLNGLKVVTADGQLRVYKNRPWVD